MSTFGGFRPLYLGFVMDESRLVDQLLHNRDALLGFILALTRNYDVAEEIFQEVAKAILEEASKGATVGQFMPWAREIARRRVNEFYRKSARRSAVETIPLSMEEVICQAFTENERTLEASHLRLKALRDCLETLSDRSREVIDEFYRNRKSVRGIAGGLGWSEQSVKTALWRSRKALADCIRGKLRAQELS